MNSNTFVYEFCMMHGIYVPSIVVEMLPTVPTGKPQDEEIKTGTSSDSN